MDANQNEPTAVAVATDETDAATVAPADASVDAVPLQRSDSFVRSLPVVDAQSQSGQPGDYNYDSVPVVATVPAIPIEPSSSAQDSRNAHPQETASVSNRQSKSPKLISVRIVKQTVDERLGISFEVVHSELYVRSLSPRGKLYYSLLKPGDKILSFNRVPCHGLSKEQAADIIRSISGIVIILAERPHGNSSLTAVCALKTASDGQTGIQLENRSGTLRIARISSDSVLGKNSLAKRGDRVLYINGYRCHSADPDIAQTLIAQSETWVALIVTSNASVASVVASDSASPSDTDNRLRGIPLASSTAIAVQGSIGDLEQGVRWNGREPMHISVSIEKPTETARLGMGLRSGEHGIEISWIRAGGLVASSPLREGLRLVSINSVSCTGLQVNEVAAKLRDFVGSLHIVAMNEHGDPSYVQAMAVKATPRCKIGVTFQRRNYQLCIGTIQRSSPFAQSVLNCNDIILAINNTLASSMTVEDAIRLVAEAPGPVTILSKTHATTGIVVAQSSQSAVTTSRNGKEYDRNTVCKSFCSLLLFVVAAGIIWEVFNS